MGILDGTLVDAIKTVDENFKQALWSIKRKESLEDVWPYWGPFFIDAKYEVEDVIRTFPVPHMCWFYAYMQNKNQLLGLHIESRAGKISKKNSLKKSSKILFRLIIGEVKPRDNAITDKVQGHLSQLYSFNKADIIIGRPIYVRDYRNFVSPDLLKKPVEDSPPAQIIVPKDTLVLEED